MTKTIDEAELPKYGSKVRATCQLVRKMKIEYKERGNYRHTNTLKYWEEKPFNGEVIYLGIRNLQNGTRDYDSEYGYYFNPTEYIKVALVSPGPRLNPIYVPLHALDAMDVDNLKCINKEEVESWLWEHVQIQGHIADGVKDERGINIKWIDRETKEEFDVLWSEES